MKLSERMAQAETVEKSKVRSSERTSKARRQSDWGPMKRRVRDVLIDQLGAKLYERGSNKNQLKDIVAKNLDEALKSAEVALPPAQRARFVAELAADLLGYGPLEALLADDSVTEIMANAFDDIYVERGGKIERSTATFSDEDHFRQVIERIVATAGRRIDESSPMVDARLPDGSRANAVIPPVAVAGPALTIRRFPEKPFQVADLIALGSMSVDGAEFLEACVRGRLNVLVSGGTGTGKTTMLNVLSGFIPPAERIITIEDAAELRLNQPHVVALESRPPNVEGSGEVRIRDLVRNALRMRPDRIIVGEVRGGESLDMLQAMNTGHEGSLTTVHCNSPRDALSRLETMVLMAGYDLPVRAIRQQIASAIDIIVHLDRFSDGSRRITHISEIQGLEGEVITLQDIFSFVFASGGRESERTTGRLQPTGLRPKVADRLKGNGVDIAPRLFRPASNSTLSLRTSTARGR